MIRRVSNKRARLNRLRRNALQSPTAPLCEAHLPGCQRVAIDPHEVKTRARGGSITDLENIVRLCRHCHDLITLYPDWSNRHGWTVPSWATDEDERVAGVVRQIFTCPITCSVDHRLDLGVPA